MQTSKYLRRKEASEYLQNRWGIRCAPGYLAKLAVTGGGPPFRKRNRDPLYAPSDLDAWVESKIGPLVSSTAELAELSAAYVGNGGKRARIEAAILTGLGVRAGVPDLICIKAGQVCSLELKAPKGRFSRDQYETIAALKATGAHVEVASSLDDALRHLERWGISRGRAQ
jgi:hypothetical protein